MNSKTYMTIALATLALNTSAWAATAMKYAVDPAASQVKWEGRKKIVDSKHYGLISVKSGQIETMGDQITSGTIELDMNAITDQDLTDAGYNQKLVGHLKGEDFFDVAKYPTSKFVLKHAKAMKGKGGATHEVMGELTIKNETHPVSFPATITFKDGKLAGKAQLTLDRTKWNIRYGSDKFFKSLGDKVIHDELKFDLDLVAHL